MDRDPITHRYNWSPRAGAALTVLPEGRGILRGGYGKFVSRTALNIEAFPQYESRVVQRFGPDGVALGRRSRSPTRLTASSGHRKPTSATSSGISASAGVCCSSSDSCAAPARTNTSSYRIPWPDNCNF
jgi:hypothetical protein